MKRLHIHGWLHGATALREESGDAGEQLVLPRRDLGGMDLKALRDFRERAPAVDGDQGDLGLEGGA